MVHEDVIEKIVAQFENEPVHFQNQFMRFTEEQPVLFSFLISDAEGIYSQDEKDFLIYLATVIFTAVSTTRVKKLPKITLTRISDKEEKNWEKIEKSRGKDFRRRLDVFFSDTVEEDLLAFIEDSLTLDGGNEEESDYLNLTPEGQEPMFVALKTLVDVLTEIKD